MDWVYRILVIGCAVASERAVDDGEIIANPRGRFRVYEGSRVSVQGLAVPIDHRSSCLTLVITYFTICICL
jgi:hypothetical protein